MKAGNHMKLNEESEQLADAIFELLVELRNEDPQHISRNVYALKFLGEGIAESDLHEAIYTLYQRGIIIFEDVRWCLPTTKFPLIYSTFHLPN